MYTMDLKSMKTPENIFRATKTEILFFKIFFTAMKLLWNSCSLNFTGHEISLNHKSFNFMAHKNFWHKNSWTENFHGPWICHEMLSDKFHGFKNQINWFSWVMKNSPTHEIVFIGFHGPWNHWVLWISWAMKPIFSRDRILVLFHDIFQGHEIAVKFLLVKFHGPWKYNKKLKIF